MKSVGISLALLTLGVSTACVPQPEPQSAPRQQPIRRPVQAPPPPAPTPSDWRDIPLTSGAWYYRDEGASAIALFGPANAEASFVVRCEKARREITLSREGETSGTLMTIRTAFGSRNFAATAQREPLPYLIATTPASDRFLDNMAFSRGRLTVEAAELPMLVLPAWPEPARVIEDCRS